MLITLPMIICLVSTLLLFTIPTEGSIYHIKSLSDNDYDTLQYVYNYRYIV